MNQFVGLSEGNYFVAGGSQSSMRLPSGSMAQPNLPNSDSSVFASTSTPSARSWVNNQSRSSTRKLIMKGFLPGSKCFVSSVNTDQAVEPSSARGSSRQ